MIRLLHRETAGSVAQVEVCMVCACCKKKPGVETFVFRLLNKGKLIKQEEFMLYEECSKDYKEVVRLYKELSKDTEGDGDDAE